MKTKTYLVMAVAMAALVWNAAGQGTPVVVVNPSPGVGVGLGFGGGVGVGGGIDVERIPGNVVQGRRVFAATFVCGSTAFDTTVPVPPGPVGGPGLTSVCGFSRNRSSESLTTSVTVFNPNTNSVTFARRAGLAGGGCGTNVTQALQPCQTVEINCGDIGLLLGNPPGFGTTRSTGFVVIESTAALEVVAVYQYRSSESTMELHRELHEDCHCNNPEPHICPP